MTKIGDWRQYLIFDVVLSIIQGFLNYDVEELREWDYIKSNSSNNSSKGK